MWKELRWRTIEERINKFIQSYELTIFPNLYNDISIPLTNVTLVQCSMLPKIYKLPLDGFM
jgi:hypothetical protein